MEINIDELMKLEPYYEYNGTNNTNVLNILEQIFPCVVFNESVYNDIKEIDFVNTKGYVKYAIELSAFTYKGEPFCIAIKDAFGNNGYYDNRVTVLYGSKAYLGMLSEIKKDKNEGFITLDETCYVENNKLFTKGY